MAGNTGSGGAMGRVGCTIAVCGAGWACLWPRMAKKRTATMTATAAAANMILLLIPAVVASADLCIFGAGVGRVGWAALFAGTGMGAAGFRDTDLSSSGLGVGDEITGAGTFSSAFFGACPGICGSGVSTVGAAANDKVA